MELNWPGSWSPWIPDQHAVAPGTVWFPGQRRPNAEALAPSTGVPVWAAALCR